MKKNYLYILIAATLMAACRPESDNLLSYGQNDGRTFDIAESSYEEQFKALWTALNCNYGIWDYEAEHGLDWDEVYETYLPKFQELDKKEEVTDDEFSQLYSEIINPLHDGHLWVQVRNLKTGRYINYMPGYTRNYHRDEFQHSDKFKPDISAYKSQSGIFHMTEYLDINTSPVAFVQSSLETFAQAVANKMDEFEHKSTLSDSEQFIYDYCSRFREEYDNMQGLSNNALIQQYNSICDKYAELGNYLNTKLIKADSKLADQAISLEYGFFESGIVYLHLSDFHLLPYLNDNYFAYFADANNAGSQAMQKAVKDVWNKWFDKIQLLDNNQRLKGVIIDVRSNGGGFVNDYQYVLGALLPSGGYTSHQLRTKNGTGRYDFSPLMNFTLPTYKENHTVVSAPIVVMTNCSSVSMSETTAWGAKTLDNGYVIGTRTWGGLCALSTDPKSFSDTYASAFGVANETAIYAYIPKYIAVLPGLGIQEGVGVIPDVEVAFDEDLFNSTGRDSQLERAIEFICSEVQ